jgi:tetratricopeptide (TPR) repeat protein
MILLQIPQIGILKVIVLTIISLLVIWRVLVALKVFNRKKSFDSKHLEESETSGTTLDKLNQSIEKSKGKNTDLLYKRFSLFLDKGNYQAGYDDLVRIDQNIKRRIPYNSRIEIADEYRKLFRLWGEDLAIVGHYEQSLEKYQAALKWGEKSLKKARYLPWIFKERATVYLKLKNIEAAKQDYKNAIIEYLFPEKPKTSNIVLNPYIENEFDSLLLKAEQAYIASNDLPGYIKLLESLTQQGDSEGIYFCYYKLIQLYKVLGEYEKALEWDKLYNDKFGTYLLGTDFLEEKSKEVEMVNKKYVLNDPNLTESLNLLCKKGYLTDAYYLLKELIHKDEQPKAKLSEYYRVLGWIAFQRWRFDSAIKYYDQAIESSENPTTDYYLELGKVLMSLHKHDEAYEIYTYYIDMLEKHHSQNDLKIIFPKHSQNSKLMLQCFEETNHLNEAIALNAKLNIYTEHSSWFQDIQRKISVIENSNSSSHLGLDTVS